MSNWDEIEVEVPDTEFWDAEKEEFLKVKGAKIRMKHSLLSISKWEMKWKKPFLQQGYTMTPDEELSYYECMTITQNINPYIYQCISPKDRQRINDYIQTPLSAYKKYDKKKPNGGSFAVVSERIYYWMTANNIPESYERWHLSRLLNLLDIAAESNSTDKNKNKVTADMLRERHNLNQARKKAWHTRG